MVLVLGMRELQRFLERWYTLWLLVQGGTAVAVAAALGRDAQTIGRWVAVFGEGGPGAMAFEQSGGSPSRSTERSRPN